MFSAWMLMLSAGNLGHHIDEPLLFVNYLFCLPFGLLFDAGSASIVRKFANR